MIASEGHGEKTPGGEVEERLGRNVRAPMTSILMTQLPGENRALGWKSAPRRPRGPAVSLRCEEGERDPTPQSWGPSDLPTIATRHVTSLRPRVTCLNGSLRGGLGVLRPP